MTDSMVAPKPLKCSYGPLMPKPGKRTMISRGLISDSVSHEIPRLSTTSAALFSTNTSASRIRPKNSSRPSSLERSTVTLLWPRFAKLKPELRFQNPSEPSRSR